MYRRQAPALAHWLSIERVCWVCLASRFTSIAPNRTAPIGRRLLTSSVAGTKVKFRRDNGEEEWLLDSSKIRANVANKKGPLNLRSEYERGQRRSIRRRQPVAEGSEYVPLDEALLDQRLNDILRRAENQEQGAESELVEAIDSIKPEATRVSEERMEQLKHELDRSFKVDQLRKYIKHTHKGLIKPYGMKKHVTIDTIFDKIWKIEARKEIDPSVDVVHKEVVESDRVKLFFIIGEGGNNIRNLANSTGAKITVQLATRSLELSGTTNCIEKCQEAIEAITKDIVQEDFDVTPILRVARFDGTLIGPISRATSTFIEKVDDKTLRIYTSGPTKQNRIDDAKRLLLNSFDLFGQHSRYSLLCETETKKTKKAALFTITENQSLPLRFRANHWSRWRSVREKPSGSTSRSVADALKRAKAQKRDTEANATGTTVAKADIETDDLHGISIAESPPHEEAPADVNASKTEEITGSAETGDSVAAEEIGLARDDEEEVSESSFQRLPGGIYASSEPSKGVKSTNQTPTQSTEEGILSDASALKDFLDHGHDRPDTSSSLPVEVEYHSYIGHVVHSAPASNSQEYTSLPALMQGNYSRLFINTVPHINDAMVRLKPYRISTHFVVQFSPSPWAQSADFENLPKVSLQLETNPVDGKISKPVLTATLYETMADVLLPDKAADVRFMRKEVLRLNEKHTYIKDYITASKLNPTKDARFITPPSIQISLPSELIRRMNKDQAETAPSKPFTTVEYYFTGLEHHSSFLYRWADQDLLYSKIEGGAAGARFQEVRLKCNTVGPVSEAEALLATAADTNSELFVEGLAERADEWWMNDDELELDRPDLVKHKQSFGYGKTSRNPNRWNTEEFHKAAEPNHFGYSKPGSGEGQAVEGGSLDVDDDGSKDPSTPGPPSPPLDPFGQFVTATRRILSLLEKSTSRSVL